jgi:LysM repeat protein
MIIGPDGVAMGLPRAVVQQTPAQTSTSNPNSPAAQAFQQTFSNLTSPTDKALETQWVNAYTDTNPANAKQDQVIEAATEAQLWQDEAKVRQGPADQAHQATQTALTQYGENSPQYLTALANEREADAQVWQANANAGQAGAQLNVYAADPAYSSAIQGAKTVIDAGLQSQGLQWMVPTAHGSLSDAQTQLTQAAQTVTDANQAVQDYQDAVTAFSQLPSGYNPTTPYQDMPPMMTSTDYHGPTWQQLNDQHKVTYYKNQKLYWAGVLDLSNGNKSLADVTVGVLKQQLSLLKPGTTDYTNTQTALNQALTDQTTAGTNLTTAQAYSTLASANLNLAQVNSQFDTIKQQALNAAYKTNSYWFDPNGFTNLNNDYSGKLKGVEVTIGKDGQLYANFTYENRTMQVQLTFPKGSQPNDPAWQQVSQAWASFNAPASSTTACLASNNVVGLANYEQVSAQQAVNGLQLSDTQQAIGQLTAIYKSTLAKYNTNGVTTVSYSTGPSGQPGAPTGTNIPPDVATAWSNLQAGQQLSTQLQSNGDWLAFLTTQDLSNFDNQDNQDALRKKFFTDTPAEQQRQFNQLAQAYGKPILLQPVAGSRLTVWDTTNKLDNGIGVALNIQPDDPNAATSGDTNTPWYSGQSLDTITTVANKVQQLAGKGGSVQVLPTFFAPTNGGLLQSALFLVTDSSGNQFIVDNNGRQYNNLQSYQQDSKIPVGGTLYLPTFKTPSQGAPGYQLAADVTGQPAASSSVVDAQGNAGFQSVKIDGPSGAWQAADTTAGIVTSIATIASFIPGLDVVAIPVAIAGGTYLGVRSGMDLADMSEHGQSWFSKEGMLDLAMVATSALPLGAGGFRLAGLMRAGMDFGPALSTSFNVFGRADLAAGPFSASTNVGAAKLLMDTGPGAFKAARGLDLTGTAIGAPLMAYTGYNTIANWNEMSGFDKLNNALGFASGLYAAGMGVHNNSKLPDTGWQRPQYDGQAAGPGYVWARSPANGDIVPAKVFPGLMPSVTPLLGPDGVLDSVHLVDPSNSAKRTGKTQRFALFTDGKTGTNFILPTLSGGQLRGLLRNGAILAIAVPAAALAHKTGAHDATPLMAGMLPPFFKLPPGLKPKWSTSKTRSFFVSGVPHFFTGTVPAAWTSVKNNAITPAWSGTKKGAQFAFVTFPKNYGARTLVILTGMTGPAIEQHQFPSLDEQGIKDWGNDNFFGRALVLIPTAWTTARGKLNPLTKTGFLLRVAAGSSFLMNSLNNFDKVASGLPANHWHLTWQIASQGFFALGQAILGARSGTSAVQSARLRRYATLDHPVLPAITVNVKGGDSWKGIAKKSGIPFGQLPVISPGQTLTVDKIVSGGGMSPPRTVKVSYNVKAGDTVETIAQNLGVSPRKVRSLLTVPSDQTIALVVTDKKGNPIKGGAKWTVNIPVKAGTPWKRVALKTGIPLIQLPGIADGVKLDINKVVKVGKTDTLDSIASANGVAPDDILLASGLTRPLITPGRKIVVPLEVTGKPGDTLASLAKKYNDKPRAILKRNKPKLTSAATDTTLTGAAYIWESGSNVSRWMQVAGGLSMASASGSLGVVDYHTWGWGAPTAFLPADIAIATGNTGTASLTALRNKIAYWKGQKGFKGAVGRALGNRWTIAVLQMTSASSLGWKGLGHEIAQHDLFEIFPDSVHNKDIKP